MPEPLATIEDAQILLGRTLEGADAARMTMLLATASGAFRRQAGGQIITLGTTTARIRSCGGKLWLPQRPVVSVISVVDADGNAVDVEWSAPDPYLTAYTGCDAWLTVEYEHGLDPVPDEVIGVVCQMAGRAFGVPVDRSGITSTTLGAFSESMGGAAAQGPVGMLAEERAVAASFRPPRRPISML